jgi:hypothetical protein
MGRFYVLSSGQGSIQCPVKLAGDIALDAPADLAVGFALGAAACDVGDGGGIAAHTGAGDDVDGLVQCPVAAPVEPGRVIWPLEASTGLVPASLAKAAS